MGQLCTAWPIPEASGYARREEFLNEPTSFVYLLRYTVCTFLTTIVTSFQIIIICRCVHEIVTVNTILTRATNFRGNITTNMHYCKKSVL